MPKELINEQAQTKHIILLQALASLPLDLTQLFSIVDELSVHRVLSPDEWSMVDVLSHLIEIEARYRLRLERVLQADEPMLPTLWPDETNHASDAGSAQLIERFRAARAKTLTFLEARSPEDWQRPAVHETFGKTDFRSLVQYLVDHDTLHLHQLVELQQRSRRPRGG